jgi:hypothetical protein
MYDEIKDAEAADREVRTEKRGYILIFALRSHNFSNCQQCFRLLWHQVKMTMTLILTKISMMNFKGSATTSDFTIK